MNSIIFYIIAVAVIVSIARRRIRQGQGQGQDQGPVSRTPHHTNQQPYKHQPYRQQPTCQQPYNQQSSTGQRPPSQTSSQTGQQQSAWDWMHSTPSQTADTRDPEGETLMYRDVPEDWIRPVEATVHVDLTEMRETQREIVHESVHESLHVRRDATSGTSESSHRHAGKISLNHANVAQALILSELLGEPRSKRPWKPQHRR